ncbi:MAG TPA: hypothetical protein VK985_05310 [Rariglobus sp.]|nr:hypothetical protein [Rariglobus sp.]
MTITYPRPDRSPSDAFGPATLGLATAQILAWRQGAGAVGGLHLHACWGVSSALARHYHGQTVAGLAHVHEGVRMLANGSDSFRWRHFADALAAQMLWLQSPKGGFIHASGENEPSYDSHWSCPIHQMLPMLALLDHYEDRPDDLVVRNEIEISLARHLDWFSRFWWKRGNDWSGPLASAGWCGVINQDLVTIAALARYGQVVGDWRPFETHGLPALDVYLGPRYFNSSLGLFERGDRADFTERSGYLVLIGQMLTLIHRIKPDSRIPPILTRITETLTDSIFVDEAGFHHMASGINDAASRKQGRRVWLRNNKQVICDYTGLLTYLAKHGDPRSTALKNKIFGLQKTVASYVFSDGTLPNAIDPEAPLFAVAPSANTLSGFWRFLINRNPAGIEWKDIPAVPEVIRRSGPVTYFNNADGWKISEMGSPSLHGIKRLSHGVFRDGEEWPGCKLAPTSLPGIEEDVSLTVAAAVAE